MKKLTVNIDEDTYRLLKGKLGYQGLSFQKWAEQQIKTFAQKPTTNNRKDLPIDSGFAGADQSLLWPDT